MKYFLLIEYLLTYFLLVYVYLFSFFYVGS